MMKTIKVSDKGQISIPNSMRQRLGIGRGDELVLVESDGKILIQKPQIILEKIKDDFKDILHFSEESLKEVWDNPEDEIWSEYLKNEH